MLWLEVQMYFKGVLREYVLNNMESNRVNPYELSQETEVFIGKHTKGVRGRTVGGARQGYLWRGPGACRTRLLHVCMDDARSAHLVRGAHCPEWHAIFVRGLVFVNCLQATLAYCYACHAFSSVLLGFNIYHFQSFALIFY